MSYSDKLSEEDVAKVKFKNIQKQFGSQKILDDFSLEIRDEEFLVLVGPSGCGKSTTLRLLSGLDQPDSGEISIDDKAMNKVDPKDRDIAMVFQNYALYPHYNVYDNLAFSLKLRKESKPTINKQVQWVSGLLGLNEVLTKKPKELSGGQRQRVALGRAMVRNPKVFLMDEPLSNLDAKLRVHMRAELMQLQKKLKTTTLYVTHDQVEAMTMGDRIVVLNEGKIQQVGTPHEIYHTPQNKFVAGFMGSPPMNFLNQGVHVLGIRPEHIGFSKDVISRLDSQTVIPRLDRGTQTTWQIEGQFKMVEPLGAESLYHFAVGQSSFVVRSSKELSFKPGQMVALFIPYEKIYLFHATSGQRLKKQVSNDILKVA
jgi:multiple sugar transport system ATP-binding protein